MARADSVISVPWKDTRTALKPGVQLYWFAAIFLTLGGNLSLTQISCEPEPPSAQQPAIERTISVGFAVDRGSGNRLWRWGRGGRCCREVPGTAASLAGTGGPAALAVGLVAWLLDQSCTSQGHLHRSRSPDSSYWEHQIWLWGWQKGQPKTFWRKLFRSSDLVFLEEIVFIRRKFSSDLQSL